MKANPANILSILQGTKVYRVPIYQRRYSWVIDQWRLLWDDIKIKTAELQTVPHVRPHFMGNIVLQEQHETNTTVTQYLVIDGQQRLITIIILLAALRDTITKKDPNSDPSEYDNKYLSNPFDADDPERLIPTEFDRVHYSKTIHEGIPSGSIGRCYTYFSKQLQEYPQEQLRTISTAVLRHLQVILVETDIDDPVNTIFNTLNSRGRPLLPPDLIRNELFSHLDESNSERLYQDRWLPIENALVTTTSTGRINSARFVTFFWSREVPHEPRLAKKSLFSAFEKRLRARLMDTDSENRGNIAEQEIEAIWEDFKFYRAAVDPTNSEGFSWKSQSLLQTVLRLTMWGSDTHIPITLWVLKRTSTESMPAHKAIELLDTVLRYIIARAIVGIPSNSLNRVLSAIPAIMENETENNLTATLIDEFAKSNNRWPGHDSLCSAYSEYGFEGLTATQIDLIKSIINQQDNDVTAISIANEFQSPSPRIETEAEVLDRNDDSIFEVLQELSPYEFTTSEDISRILRIELDVTRDILLTQDDSILSLLRTEDDQPPKWIPAARRKLLEEPTEESARRQYVNYEKLSTLLNNAPTEFSGEAV